MNENLTIYWSRIISDIPVSGRMLILSSLRKICLENFKTTEIVVPQIFARGMLCGFVNFMHFLLLSIARFELPPLQCALYFNSAVYNRVKVSSVNETFIFDSIRHYSLIVKIRKNHPNAKIILDMDDLMSERMNQTLLSGETPSLGFLGEFFPKVLLRMLSIGSLSRLILKYEKFALLNVERKIGNFVDYIVMVSEKEATKLETFIEGSVKVITIPPPVISDSADIKFFDGKSSDFLCYFVGSDKLLQNSTVIDELLRVWKKFNIERQLIIIGNQHRVYQNQTNIHFAGYVDDIRTIVDGNAVLINPAKIRGGVKTKVLEAFNLGAPVIGSEIAFEGMGKSKAFLTIEDVGGYSGLNRPEALSSILAESARIGHEYVSREFGMPSFSKKWLNLINGTISGWNPKD